MADLEDIGHIPGADPDDDSPYAGYTARDEENEFERIRNRGKAKGKAPELPKGPSASYKTLSYELSVASAKNRLSLSGNA